MKTPTIIILGVLSLPIIGFGLSIVSTATTVATAPGRVINRTLETDNIINNYEWFHDANAAYKTRVSQIQDFRSMLKETSNEQEKNRIRTDVAAIRQSCRDLATRYNANATKSNRSIFMGRETPETLSMEACDL